MLAWILLALLLVGAVLYFVFTPADVDPHFLANQASVSSTRLSGESAVVRSLVNPHGHALLGEAPPLSRFRFADLAPEADNFSIVYVTQRNEVKKVPHFGHLVGCVQQALKAYPTGSRISLDFDAGLEALVCFFAVVLSGCVAVVAEEAEDSVLSRAGADRGRNRGILVKQPDGSVVSVPLTAGEEKLSVASGGAGSAGSTILEVVNEQGAHTIGEVELGTAVGAQLAALAQHHWTQHDTVFVAPGPLTVYSLVAMLACLSTRGTLAFAEPGPMLTAQTALQLAKATVLVSDDESMLTLVKQVDEFQAIKWLFYGIRRLRLVRGALTRPPMEAGLRHVRLVHSAGGGDPFKWLTNGDIATLRVLSAAQVIHVYTPAHGLPLAQTVVGDYRTNRKAGVNWGPPLPGVELKKNGAGELEARWANQTWQAVPPASAQKASLLRDGCLYVPEKRHDFSDYYYYTGELK